MERTDVTMLETPEEIAAVAGTPERANAILANMAFWRRARERAALSPAETLVRDLRDEGYEFHREGDRLVLGWPGEQIIRLKFGDRLAGLEGEVLALLPDEAPPTPPAPEPPPLPKAKPALRPASQKQVEALLAAATGLLQAEGVPPDQAADIALDWVGGLIPRGCGLVEEAKYGRDATRALRRIGDALEARRKEVRVRRGWAL
jgi:hypothetical protein